VVSQIRGDYQAKEPLMQKYLALVRENLIGFSRFEIKHVPRSENSRADLLSKLASTKSASVLHSVIEEVIPAPGAILQVESEDWRTSLKNYIAKGILPQDQKEAQRIVQKSTRYAVIEGHLFRKGLSTPLLKCIGPSEVWYILAEIHEGSYGHHLGGKLLARKSLRAGYFWPTMNSDSAEYVKRCRKCQEHSPLTHIPAENLHNISTSWPFHTWGLDLLGPFPPTAGQLKHLIVAVDYYTKWIEMEPLASIASIKVQKFVFNKFYVASVSQQRLSAIMGLDSQIRNFEKC
jgi:hypothetical protein